MRGLSVGIGGISRAGKTKLSKHILSLYPQKKILIIEMDKYVKDELDIPKIRNHTDWEHPISIDFARLKKTIKQALNTYNIVITEGILIFYSKELNSLFDKKIFINIPKSTFYERKQKDERWGKEPSWYIDYIWKSYLMYGKLKEKSDVNTLYIHDIEDWSPILLDEHLYKVDYTS